MARYGVGIDIEDIERFRGKPSEEAEAFSKKVFTSGEISYCRSRKDPEMHLALRFAAKEAVYKAICSCGLESSVNIKDIEVSKLLNGAPVAKVHSAGCENLDLRLSMASSKGMVVAFAVAEAR